MLEAVTGWDWFVGLVALVSVGAGLIRGLVRTVFALGAWAVGVLGVPVLAPMAVGLVPDGVPQPAVFALIFLTLFVAVRVLGSLAARALHGIGMGGFDRMLGAGLGLVRAAIIVLVAALIAHLGGFSKHPSWTQALSRPVLEAMVKWAEPYLPEQVSGVRRT